MSLGSPQNILLDLNHLLKQISIILKDYFEEWKDYFYCQLTYLCSGITEDVITFLGINPNSSIHSFSLRSIKGSRLQKSETSDILFLSHYIE